jgi:nitroreductase
MIKHIYKFMFMLKEYVIDIYLYTKYNQKSPFSNRIKSREYSMVIESHKIEKGLSLHNPRPLFGEKVVSDLKSRICGDDSFAEKMTKGALYDYYKSFREHLSDSDNEYFDSTVLDWEVDLGGASPCLDVDKKWSKEVFDFSISRRSVRQYLPGAVPEDLIRSVIQVANNAPSQCNRQSVRIRYLCESEDIAKALSLQGCAGSFSKEVDNLFIVYSEISAWSGPQQRNQMFVDGGIFVMKLLDSLWLHNLGGCCLNAALKHDDERKIKIISKIPEDTRLIAMIAFGYPNVDGLKSAVSPRRSLGELVH